MAAPLRVLFVEDSPDDVRLLEAHLARAGYEPQVHCVDDAAGFEAALAASPWDVIIADYSLPRFSAPEALRLTQASGRDLPFIILSGTINEEEAVTSLRAGAHDFVTKGNLARLIPALERERRDAANREAQRAAQRSAEAARQTAEAAQHERERSFRVLFASNPLPMWVYDAQTGAFVEVNDAALTTYGYAREEFLALSPEALLASRPPPGRVPAAAPTPQPLQHRLKDGRLIDVETASHALENAGRRLVLVVAHDVTHSRRQLERLAGLRAVEAAISGSLDLQLTLSILLGQVLEQLAVEAAAVFMFSPHSQLLTFAAGRGFRTAAPERAQVRLGDGHLGRTALRRLPVEVLDLSEAPDSSPLGTLLASEGFVALHGLPLIAKGQLLGVLAIFRRRAPATSPEDQLILEALAGQAAIAIENAKLFEGLQRSNTDLTLAYDATLLGWARTLDQRNQEAEGHSQRVAELAQQIARALGLDETKLAHLRRGALLHDLGHLSLPEELLRKPGPLTEAEWEQVRQHPTWTHAMLAPVQFLQAALDVPLYHHEKWDGTGYPHGLRGPQIPLVARICAVADVWVTLCSERAYRPAWSTEQARAYLQAEAGRHFDPEVVAAFLRLDAAHLPGPPPA